MLHFLLHPGTQKMPTRALASGNCQEKFKTLVSLNFFFTTFNQVLQEKGKIVRIFCESFPDIFSNLENTAAPRGPSTEAMRFRASGK